MSAIDIRKTYKLYLGGAFERSESGRTVPAHAPDGTFLAHVCATSRKDLRRAVSAARVAAKGWMSRSAYNRGQILYRIAEVLSQRASDFRAELIKEGFSEADASSDLQAAIDLWVAYAGWTDKFPALFSSVNPVASPHFSFSVPEPVGTVGVDAGKASGLSGLTACLAPVLCGGNSAVVVVPEHGVLACNSFAEVLHTSDVPGGAANLLTHAMPDVADHLAAHRDLPSTMFVTHGFDAELQKRLQPLAADTVKRIRFVDAADIPSGADPFEIMAYQEVKTTWHPIGM